MSFEKFIELYENRLSYNYSFRIDEHFYIENEEHTCSIRIVTRGSEGGNCWEGITETFTTLLNIHDTILFSTCFDFFKTDPTSVIDYISKKDMEISDYYDYYGNYEVYDKYKINLNLLYKNMLLEKLRS